MALFERRKNGGFMDVIRCDLPSYLIWKWHPSGVEPGHSERENAIRLGSSLRVKDGEVAVFVYSRHGGEAQEFVEGPRDMIVSTANLPILANIIGLAYEGGTPFQAEVYFINLAQVIQVKFGVPYFDVYDPRFGDFGVPVAVRGTVSFKITDYKDFIKLHRLSTFRLENFQSQIRDAITRYVKDTVANAPAAANIPLVQIETQTAVITDTAELYIKERLKEDFGVDVSGVDIGAIELDKSSEGYRYLMSVTRDIAGARVQADTKDYIERLRIMREEGQYSLHKQTQSANIGAFQVEKQAEVGIAGAEALGKMGENGADNIDLDGGGNGFNMAALMASMAVGGAVGQNIAGSMNNMMSGINNPVNNGGATPPPVPVTSYFVAVNGQANGPFDMATLTKMTADGQLSSDSLVWKNGMEQWEKAGEVNELKSLFPPVPPIPPVPPVPGSEK